MKFEKHIKKTALGLAVLGLAVATSAFTNRLQGPYLTNNGTEYEFKTTLSGTCESGSTEECVYIISDTSEVSELNAPFSYDDVANFLEEGWITTTNGPGQYEEPPVQ